MNGYSLPALRSACLLSSHFDYPYFFCFLSLGNLDLRLAEMIDPHHPEVLFFNDRIHIESEKLFRLSLKAFSDQCYSKAVTLLRHAISLSPLDVKLHITEAKVHRMAGDLEVALDVIQGAAILYGRATRVACTSPNADTNIDDNSDQPRELPDDILLQKSLIINDMAIESAGKGDYIRAIALLNRIVDPPKHPGHQAVLTRALTSHNDSIKNKFEEVVTYFALLLNSIGLCWTTLRFIPTCCVCCAAFCFICTIFY